MNNYRSALRCRTCDRITALGRFSLNKTAWRLSLILILLGGAGLKLDAQTAPAPVSVTPASGTGATQAFTAVFTDPNGGTDISETDMYITSNVLPGSTSGWSAHECIARYQSSSNTVSLVVDAGGSFGVSVGAGGPGVASNSQCTILGSGSSATVSGNTLTVAFDIQFNGSDFSSTKQIYLAAGNNAGNWSTNYQQQFGTWTIPSLPAVPTPVSISPSSGNNEAQAFTATFTDPNGASDIHDAEMYIMNGGVVPGSVAGWSAHECIVRLDPVANNLYLVVDDGGSFAGPLALGANAVLQNSQCTLAAFDSSKAASGNTLSAQFAVFFNTTNFYGTKQLYLIGQNSSGQYSSNYQTQFASFTVPQLSPESCDISDSPNPTTLLSVDYYDESVYPPQLFSQDLGSAVTTASSPAPACWQLAWGAVFTLPLELDSVSGPILESDNTFQSEYLWIDDGDRSCFDPDTCYPLIAPGALSVTGIDVTNGTLLDGNASIVLTVFSSFIN